MDSNSSFEPRFHSRPPLKSAAIDEWHVEDGLAHSGVTTNCPQMEADERDLAALPGVSCDLHSRGATRAEAELGLCARRICHTGAPGLRQRSGVSNIEHTSRSVCSCKHGCNVVVSLFGLLWHRRTAWSLGKTTPSSVGWMGRCRTTNRAMHRCNSRQRAATG